LRGSHPAFFWTAALLKAKGKSVAIIHEPELPSWEYFPTEVLSFLGLTDLKTDRDHNPIQILSRKSRLGIFGDLEFTLKDFKFCAGNSPAPELNRGISFYAKSSDYPVVFGESSSELLAAAHRMDYFEKPAEFIKAKVTETLRQLGVVVLDDDRNLPIADQTVVLDLSRAKIFRTKFEFTLPLKTLPEGASNRMLFVERNSPLIEMTHLDGVLHFRTYLPEEPLLIQKILTSVQPYFLNVNLDITQAKVVPTQISHHDWVEFKSNVDASKLSTWYISPAINPELGERSLYIRLSELLSRKYKKQQIFDNNDLFLS